MSNKARGEVWIYHERQQDLLCGQHALNNLIQESVFSPESLAVLAQELDAKELHFMSENNEGGVHSKDYIQRMQEGSGNVDAHGNFSIQVLRQALQNQYGLELPNIRQQGINQQEPTTMEGFICNKHSHWFAIRKINGRYWNLNSTKDLPELISHFNLAKEIEKLYQDGYSVFCVSNTAVQLPPACFSVSEMEKRKDGQQKSVLGNWWKESDLLSGKANTIVQNNKNNNGGNGQNSNNNSGGSPSGDPWKNVGSGMRLDGRSTTAPSTTVSLPPDVAGALTEEEQLQFAMAASFQANTNTTTSNASNPIVIIDDVQVPEEPPAGTPGSARIQFRLPSKPRLVRRFMETDSVKVLLSFCKQQEGGASNLELKYGYPPKDLKQLADQTIGEAKLAGESIQGRCV